MSRVWLTIGTPTMPGMLNPLTAACDRGFVPDEVQVLSNPGVADSVADATDLFDTIISAYDGEAEISQYNLRNETNFEEIIEFYRSTVTAAKDDDDTVAIDVTPGRKFMSAIAFQAGFRLGVDHVYYFHRNAGGYYGQFYAEMPRTATNLIDFTQVLS